MRIGIDASRAFTTQRTGIEEYSFQVIKHLREQLTEDEVVLYVKRGDKCPFELPFNWKLKEVPFNYLWTQVGLAWEMLTDLIDVLFVPAHTVPWIYPVRTVVTVHGLEYEHCPESYSLISRLFHRFFVKKSCRWASKIISVSENTKKDLIKMYEVPKEKITVVYNGYTRPDSAGNETVRQADNQYVLYIGRIEKRKNIEGIVKAFDILKQQYGYEGQLILVGRPGHGYEQIKELIATLPSRHDICELGFIAEERKWELLQQADLFLFPSLCEGFGIPILEAQAYGIPVITSNIGPLDEVAGDENILVDPHDPEAMAVLANKILTDNAYKQAVVQKGLENIQRFSWSKSAEQTSRVLKA